MSKYAHLEKAELLRLLERRDAERQLGLVWERDEIEADAAINDDYVALTLDETLSFSSEQAQAGPGRAGPGRVILMHIRKVGATS